MSESLADLRRLCHEWKKPFRAAYSAGANFKQLIAVRAAVEAALASPPAAPAKVEAEIPVAEAVSKLLNATAQAVQSAPTVVPLARAAAAAAGASGQSLASTAAKLSVSKPAVPNLVAPPELDLEGCLEQIAAKLINTMPKAAPVTNLMIGSSKVLLASWELAAFVNGGDDVADALQRAVAARALLNAQMEAITAGRTVDLADTLKAAHLEAAQLQELIAKAKDAKNIDAAVNLAASAKRLLAAIEEAGKLK